MLARRGGSPFPVSGIVRGIILQVFAFVRASCFPKIGVLVSLAGGFFTALSGRFCGHIVLLSWFLRLSQLNRSGASVNRARAEMFPGV